MAFYHHERLLKHSVSGRIYKCKKCKLEINRDINGARNIYLKYQRYKHYINL
jgi:transposase